MSLINWVQYTEPVVGAGAPGLADVTNRPLQEILAASGFTNPLADFPGFVLALDPIFNSDVTINGNLDVLDDVTVGGNVIISGGVTFSGNVTFPADVNVVGHFSVNTNKFNVDPANGNTLVAGTLGIIGSVSINTSKFTVDAATGNTIIAGTAGITGAVTGGTYNAQTISSTTSFTGTVAVASDFSINTSKFTVIGSSGNTLVAGTLGVTGAITSGLINSQTISSTANFTGTLNSTGNFSVGTTLFTVAATSGNTVIGGSITFSTAITKIVPGATSFNVYNNAGTIVNLNIPDAGGMNLALPSSGQANFNFSDGEVGQFFVQVPNGTMPQSLQLRNASTTAGHRSLSLFTSNGSTGTVGAYYFTGSNVRTAWEYANITGNNPIVLRMAPEGGETRFGDNFSNASIVSRVRMYGTSTSNNGNVAQTLVVQQGGIATDTLLLSGDLTAGARLVFSTAVSKIIPGATSISFRNNADSVDNLIITNNGIITTINNVVISSGGLKFSSSVSDLWDGTGSGAIFHYRVAATPQYIFRQAQGTLSVPTATTNANGVGQFLFEGYTGSAYAEGAGILAVSTQAWTAGAQGTQIVFQTTPNSSTTNTTALTLGQDQGAIFTGLITGNAGITVTSGQTLTLTGTTVAGTPTWSSNQAITLSTAAQGNITSVGTLTSITTSGALTFSASSSRITPGATSIVITNNANTQNNFILTDSGSLTILGSIFIGTGGTQESSTPGLNVNTASQNGISLGVDVKQPNIGTSAAVGYSSTLVDSTSAYVRAMSFFAQKSAAWTNGSASTFMSKSIIQVLVSNVLTTYLTIDGNTSTTTINSSLVVNNTITTAAPSGGTAGAWKLGILVTAAATVDLTKYIQLDVGGTLYKLITST